MGYKQALALGFELSGYIFASYLAHPLVATYINWEANNTLGLLLTLSLVIWTARAFFFFQADQD